MKELAGNGNAPLQRLDEATNSLKTAQSAVEQAKFAYEEAVAGPTKEQRDIARANVAEAQASVNSIRAQVDELVVKAPIAAQVYQIGAELGEYVSPGVPLLSLVDLSDVWLRFDLREDLVKRIKLGQKVTMRAPALGDRADRRRSQVHRAEGRICRLARHARHGRLRPQNLRGARLSHSPCSGPAAGNERLRDRPDERAMKRPPRPGIILVATRELRWMRRDRVALFLALGVPLIAFALLAFTFSNPVIRDLRVSVVDDDRSSTSRSYIQAIASAPGVQVAERSTDLTSAMHAIRSGEAIASVYIPPDFQRDLQSEKRPQIVVFYNRQYLTPGNNASSAISGAINAATASLAKSGPSSTFRPGAIAIEQYTLTNPALNFAQFLLRAVLPTVLHVVVAISAGYAVGSEFSRRSRRAWLKAAGGSPLAALFGKLAPLVRHLRGDGGDRKRDRPRAVCGPVSWRRRSHGRGGMPAGARLSGRWSAVPTPRAQSSARAEHHRHLLLARLRLRRRWISNLGHERVRAILGRPSAVALVHPDPVRPGRARPADMGDRACVRCPRRDRDCPDRALLGAPLLHRGKVRGLSRPLAGAGDGRAARGRRSPARGAQGCCERHGRRRHDHPCALALWRCSIRSLIWGSFCAICRSPSSTRTTPSSAENSFRRSKRTRR